jgi:SAM-dependent methyltransferase
MPIPASPSDPAFPADAYDAIAPGYYDLAYRRGRGVQWFWHRERFRQVERSLPGGGALLDIGCGPGTFLGHYATGYMRRLGLELSAAQVAYAREHYGRAGCEFRVADLREARLDERFDAVVAIEVIEHLPASAARSLLEDLREVLAPGGTLVLATPNRRSHWPLLERVVSRLGPVDYVPQHINLYDAERLRREVEAAGFESVVVRTFFVAAPFLAALSTRLAERALAWEQRRLASAGCELLLVARRPLESTP